MAELAAAYANALFANLVEGTAVGSGNRFLALATDAGYTEATGGSYARQDISTSWGAPTAGDGATDTAVVFAALAADTYTHWMIFDASTAGNWIVRDALPFPQTVTGGGSVTFAIGDGLAGIDPM